jgi:hypothetical protein
LEVHPQDQNGRKGQGNGKDDAALAAVQPLGK